MKTQASAKSKKWEQQASKRARATGARVIPRIVASSDFWPLADHHRHHHGRGALDRSFPSPALFLRFDSLREDTRKSTAGAPPTQAARCRVSQAEESES